MVINFVLIRFMENVPLSWSRFDQTWVYFLHWIQNISDIIMLAIKGCYDSSWVFNSLSGL